jgi:hypothetical protein
MASVDRIEKFMQKLRADPDLFVRHVLHGEPSAEQREVLRAIAQTGAHVAVRSGRGVGKSSVVAWVILWGLSCFDQIKIPITAPKFENITKITIWPEVDKWMAGMEGVFKGRIRRMSETITVFGSETSAYAFPLVAPADNQDAMQGVHADNVIYIVDEAAGVHGRVWPAIEGSLTTVGSRILMVGNPTRTDGYFAEAFGRNRAGWNCLHFNAEKSTLTDKKLLAQWEKQYGRDSNFYRVMVLGEFPKASADQLIQLDWLESAVGRESYSPMAVVRAGLDVAYTGDDSSALVLRRGNEIIWADKWQGHDTMQTCGRVMRIREEHPFANISVDVIGYGAGVANRLRELGVPTIAVNVSESASQRERFWRLRDELWFKAREFFEGLAARIDPALPYKDDLIAQLSVAKLEPPTSEGKLRVIGKALMRKDGGSPDLADAFCLSLGEGEMARVAGDVGRVPREEVSAGWMVT